VEGDFMACVEPVDFDDIDPAVVAEAQKHGAILAEVHANNGFAWLVFYANDDKPCWEHVFEDDEEMEEWHAFAVG
jgi:hypothetical protein